jgi:hypothetical protein
MDKENSLSNGAKIVGVSKYAVGVLNMFDNENRVVIVEAPDQINAVIEAVVESSNSEAKEDIRKWLSELDVNSVDELLSELFNGDLCVSVPVEV